MKKNRFYLMKTSQSLLWRFLGLEISPQLVMKRKTAFSTCVIRLVSTLYPTPNISEITLYEAIIGLLKIFSIMKTVESERILEYYN